MKQINVDLRRPLKAQLRPAITDREFPAFGASSIHERSQERKMKSERLLSLQQPTDNINMHKRF